LTKQSWSLSRRADGIVRHIADLARRGHDPNEKTTPAFGGGPFAAGAGRRSFRHNADEHRADLLDDRRGGLAGRMHVEAPPLTGKAQSCGEVPVALAVCSAAFLVEVRAGRAAHHALLVGDRLKGPLVWRADVRSSQPSPPWSRPMGGDEIVDAGLALVGLVALFRPSRRTRWRPPCRRVPHGPCGSRWSPSSLRKASKLGSL